MSLLQAGGPPMNHKKHVAAIVDGMVTYMHKNFPPGGATFVGTVFDLSPQSAGARRVFPTEFFLNASGIRFRKHSCPLWKLPANWRCVFGKCVSGVFSLIAKWKGSIYIKTPLWFRNPRIFFFESFWPGDFVWIFCCFRKMNEKNRSFQLHPS